MRKHSVRKWLHAILDLLPVIILPIFAIYSHRHTIDSYEVTVPQNEVITWNQIYNGNGTTKTSGTSTLTQIDNSIVVDVNANAGNLYFGFDLPTFEADHIYYFKSNGSTSYAFTYLYIDSVFTPIVNDNIVVYNGSQSLDVLVTTNDNFVGHFEYYFNIFDITLMYGSGNEITTTQFNTYFPSYYQYDSGTKQLHKDVSTVTYDNTDIGSQMIYLLYKPINDYFNLNNVFNFGAIYDWFELNMFNGNAPLSIFIVWNIIVYEFIMDIIFLVYSVFMFVIDFACETLDRFTGWAKRGD